MKGFLNIPLSASTTLSLEEEVGVTEDVTDEGGTKEIEEFNATGSVSSPMTYPMIATPPRNKAEHTVTIIAALVSLLNALILEISFFILITSLRSVVQDCLLYTNENVKYNTYMIKPYKKSYDYSYTLGYFPTFEMLNNQPDLLRVVYASNDAVGSEGFKKLQSLVLADKIIISDNALNKLSDKGNDYVIGVFSKKENELDKDANHVVLVNPSDMGNLGNIMRSMVAFNYKNLAIITPGADEFNPKTVRASMGAIFRINIEKFSSFDEYLNKYKRPYVPFMLQATKGLKDMNKYDSYYALCFGNEATGLPIEMLNADAVKIEQSDEVDSLNLTTAVAIALYEANRINS